MSALAEALVAAQAELPCALGKDADGQIQSRTYRYLTLDKLIAETRPILNHGRDRLFREAREALRAR